MRVSRAHAAGIVPTGTTTSEPIDVGYRDHAYGSGPHSKATAEKPQSKLWWHDGFWWGCLWDMGSGAHRIHRLDVATQSWISVGPNADNRSGTIVDCLWDGSLLHIISHEFEGSAATRLWSYTYSGGSYSLRAGFPVDVNSEGAEAVTIDKDGNGKLWVTWESGGDIMVNRSLSSDTDWGTPFVLPVQGSSTSSDDISAVARIDGGIGVLWSNQRDKKIYFARHLDGQADTSWESREVALSQSGASIADDHLNLAVTPNGYVYAVTKTSMSNSNDPIVYLIRRAPNGNWTDYVVALKSSDYTRPSLLVDVENDKIYVFSMASGTIWMKVSDLNNISFGSGRGEMFINSDQDNDINDPTSTKQSVNGTTNLLLIASDEGARCYFHNFIDLPGGGGTLAPDIAVSPSAHDYGSVAVGTNETHSFEVRNDGTADLDVSSTTLAGSDPVDFVIANGTGSFTLAPGATQDVVVRFEPSSAGSKSASLRFASNDPNEDPLDVDLSGDGVEPDIGISPTSYDYGSVDVGSSAAHTFEVRNDGGANLEVSSTVILGASDFRIASGGGAYTLAPGERRDVVVLFEASDAGARNATLRLASDDPDEDPLDVALGGEGVINDFIVTPRAHDFGVLPIGASALHTFLLQNDGSSMLDITSTTLVGSDAGDFTLVNVSPQGRRGRGRYDVASIPDAFSLAPGATQQVTVCFKPASPGAKDATLRFDCTQQGVVDVPLTGATAEPNIAVQPASHDFGRLDLGAASQYTFVVRNDGTAILDVASTQIVGANAAEFQLVSGGGAFALQPGATRDLEVRFQPGILGSKTAALRIASNDPDAGTFDVALGGIGGDAMPLANVSFEESASGGAVASLTVSTTTSVTPVAGDLYLAAIASKGFENVVSVNGMGLTWTRVGTQCGGRHQTGVEVWRGEGEPTSGVVTATHADVTNGVLIVSRYSGADPTTPVGAVASANTNGIDGLCDGGLDGTAYSLPITISSPDAVVFGAVAMRSKDHFPAAGWSTNDLVRAGSGGSIASVSVVDSTIASPGAVLLAGSFDAPADWAVIGIEIRPATGVIKPSARATEATRADTPRLLALRVRRTGGGTAHVELVTPASTRVRVTVHDVRGRLLQTLWQGPMTAGRHQLEWQADRWLASGVYFIRAESASARRARKLVLLR
ncbi:MAG: choice-of-anchor D domain-containing protein [Candidatus Latescibacterota bacterium]|nr:MAG: choice-of-anchor D domain-containing protein [Candidatus Latescibacterota bacterium]